MNNYLNNALLSLSVNTITGNTSSIRDFSDDYINSVFSNESDLSTSNEFSPKSDISPGSNGTFTESGSSGAESIDSETNFSGFGNVNSETYCPVTENVNSGSFCSGFSKRTDQFSKFSEKMNSSDLMSIFDQPPIELSSAMSDSSDAEAGNYVLSVN